MIPEPPLLVLPTLATAIGLNEAIILQQMHYWLATSQHVHDGRKWIYNSYPSWQKQFPFWSVETIKRTIKHLEDTGVVVSGNYNTMKIDKTKWYSIDYEKLPTIEELSPTMRSICTDEGNNMTRRGDQVDPTLPETTTKTTTKEEEPPYIPPKGGLLFDEYFWQPYPRKRGKGHAEKAWAKLKPTKELAQRIADAIEQQKNWRACATGFVPEWKDPATWLNAKGWEDEYTEGADSGKSKMATRSIPASHPEWDEFIAARQKAASDACADR